MNQQKLTWFVIGLLFAGNVFALGIASIEVAKCNQMQRQVTQIYSELYR